MAQQCLVRDLMLTSGAQPIPLNFPLRLAAERLLKSESDVLPVVDEHGRLAGVLSESSVVRLLLTHPAPDMTIQSVISRHAESVYEETPLSSISHMFRADCHSAIPVVNRDGLVTGVIIRRHVMTVLLGANPTRTPLTAVPIQVVGLAAPTPTAPGECSREQSESEKSLAENPVSPQSSESQKDPARPNPGEPPRPHFLRAEEARRRLTLFDDQSDR